MWNLSILSRAEFENLSEIVSIALDLKYYRIEMAVSLRCLPTSTLLIGEDDLYESCLRLTARLKRRLSELGNIQLLVTVGFQANFSTNREESKRLIRWWDRFDAEHPYYGSWQQRITRHLMHIFAYQMLE